MTDFDEQALPSDDEVDGFANELVYMAADGRLVGETEALEIGEFLVEAHREAASEGFVIPRDDDPPPQLQFERP
jgi:hypothetical protein